jgi:site-specific recombinase XerD
LTQGDETMTKLTEAIEQYIDDVCSGKTNETASAYRGKLRRLVEFLGDRPISAVKPRDLKDFRHYLQNVKVKRRGGQMVNEPLSKWTIHTVLITTATTMGEFWEQARNVALLYCLRDTGGRIGGLLNARLDDLDLKAGLLTVCEKGNRMRDLPLNDPVRAALRQWLKARALLEPETDHLFIGLHGRPLTRNSLYSILERLKMVGHIRGRLNPYSFRHAFARDALRNGGNIGEVSQLMGHKSPATTLKYYSCWTGKELQAAHRRISPGANLKVIRLKSCR